MIFQIGKDRVLHMYNFYYIHDIVYFRCLDLWFDGMNFFPSPCSQQRQFIKEYCNQMRDGICLKIWSLDTKSTKILYFLGTNNI